MQRTMQIVILGSALLGATLAPAFQVLADDDRREDGHRVRSSLDDEQHERDLVLKAVRRGEILPLATLKASILQRWPGDLVGLEIDREDGRILYEFRILRPDGRLTEVEVNAADGSVLEVENE